MKKETLKVLQSFANSGIWDLIRDDILYPLLDSIKDVSQPLRIGDKEVDPEKAYMGKVLAAQKFQEFIDKIDRIQKGKSGIKDINFE